MSKTVNVKIKLFMFEQFLFCSFVRYFSCSKRAGSYAQANIFQLHRKNKKIYSIKSIKKKKETIITVSSTNYHVLQESVLLFFMVNDLLKQKVMISHIHRFKVLST